MKDKQQHLHKDHKVLERNEKTWQWLEDIKILFCLSKQDSLLSHASWKGFSVSNYSL